MSENKLFKQVAANERTPLGNRGRGGEELKTKFFQSQKIMDNVTMIAGLAGELCYLVEGG